jgi:hypothetical protein
MLSAHTLLIQSSRYGSNRIPIIERFCIYCILHDIEDEYHFVCYALVTMTYEEKYIKRFYNVKPSIYNFVKLLDSDNKIILRNLACYIRKALAKRTSVAPR